MVAIGTMDPQIEIWDLNVYNPIYPTAVLGKKTKKKAKINSEYHVNAVMSLSWNTHYR
jgi:periodic tryptophan protein 1